MGDERRDQYQDQGIGSQVGQGPMCSAHTPLSQGCSAAVWVILVDTVLGYHYSTLGTVCAVLLFPSFLVQHLLQFRLILYIWFPV